MSNISKDTNTSIRQPISTVLSKPIVEKVFLKDFKKAFVFKKTNKLAHAVALVVTYSTSRGELVARIESIATSLPGEVLREGQVANCDPARSILEIVSLLEIARNTQQVHQGNADILIKEYQYLLATICDEVGDAISFDLEVEEVEEVTPKQETQTARISQKPVSTPRQPSVLEKKETGRTQKILDTIKSKRHASIKDISSVVLNVSEKTIQRELAKLIQQGRVRKEGERRWSTYHYVA